MGPVLLIFAMAVVMPIGLFLVGAAWSGMFGWFLADDVDTQAETPVEVRG
jgi:hypothetical protein